MKRNQWLVVSLCFGSMLALLHQSPGIQRFVQFAKEQAARPAAAVHVPAGGALAAGGVAVHHSMVPGLRAKARETIEAEAAKSRLAPVNARVDRVWKAIPGYNGVEADIEASLRLNEQLSFPDPPRLVLREVPPEVSLDKLGAHPVYKGNPGKAMAALMINVAWGDEYIPGMLATLQREQVRATFFFDGSWLSKHIDTARTIKEAGHELANHAYSHKMMSRLSRGQAEAEITKTKALLEQELGVSNTLFAPPSGDFNQQTVDIAYAHQLRTVLWTLDTVDWTKPAPDAIVRKIGARVEPGSLILMHPTSSSSQALEGMIRAIKAKGLALDTVSEVLSERRYPRVESTR